MKPGERIRLITEAAESLMTRSWDEAQLILDQFGFETYDAGGRLDFDSRSYFVEQVKEGGDESLSDLHEYLRGDDAAPTSQQVTDRPWGSQPVSVFLSHHHDDALFVGHVKKILSDHYGMDAFVAHDNIDPSRKWRDVIKAALASCHMLVAILHPEFHASQWCDQEVGWALGRNVPIVPVRRTGVPRRDGFLEEHQDVTLAPRYGSGEWWLARQIFDVALADARTHRVGVKALAEAFANSFSFDNTREMWSLVENEPHIESEQLRRLEYGVQTNRQVYEAVRAPEGTPIPDLVKQLVARFEPPILDPWAAPAGQSEPPF